jgi:hypothetical protein
MTWRFPFYENLLPGADAWDRAGTAIHRRRQRSLAPEMKQDFGPIPINKFWKTQPADTYRTTGRRSAGFA